MHLLGCNYRLHTFVLVFLVLLIQGFLAISIFWKKWVYFETDIDDNEIEYEGSLFSVDKADSIDNYGYDCKAIPSCDADSDNFECLTYDALMKAGIVYVQLEIVNWGLLICWLFTVIHLAVFKRDVGSPILNYMFAHLGWITHLCAILVWILLTEAKFEGKDKCDNNEFDTEEKLDVCATVGPYIAFAQFFV
jgi:hypothetical protein